MAVPNYMNNSELIELFKMLNANKKITEKRLNKLNTKWQNVAPSYGGNLSSALGMIKNDEITLEDLANEMNYKIKTPKSTTSTATNAANTAKEGAKVAWGQNLKNKLNDFKANTTWTKGSGLQYKNHNIGKWSNIGQGVYQGVSALNNLGDLGDLREDTDTLENDIIRSAMSNPLASSYLTSDQEALLNKLRNGTYSEDADGGDFFDGVFSGLGNIATGVLMGAPGGVPGMIIGGLGSAINSGIQGMQQGQTETNAQLQGLYSALNQAEQQYRAMRRPNVTGLGLRQSALEQMY